MNVVISIEDVSSNDLMELYEGERIQVSVVVEDSFLSFPLCLLL